MDKAILALALRRAGFSTLEKALMENRLARDGGNGIDALSGGLWALSHQSDITLTKIVGLYGTTVAAIETPKSGHPVKPAGALTNSELCPLGFQWCRRMRPELRADAVV